MGSLFLLEESIFSVFVELISSFKESGGKLGAVSTVRVELRFEAETVVNTQLFAHSVATVELNRGEVGVQLHFYATCFNSAAMRIT